MANLYVLVGISGSGKSTWATQNLNKKFNKILSSDDYRMNILGDVNDQTHNGEIFDILYKDTIKNLLNSEDICFDATNINRKSRKKLFDSIKHIKNVRKIAVVFATPLDIIYSQNDNRGRNVPEFVINRQLERFEMPFIEEGFSDIWIIDHSMNELFSKNVIDIYKSMVDFNQNNPHHKYTLDEHCRKCYDSLMTVTEEPNILVASRFHDYGKLFTQTTDDDGTSHYFNHENVGAYQSLFIDFKSSGMMVDRSKVAFYINYHMEPFRIQPMGESKRNFTINSFGREWDNLLKLHNADILSS